MSVRNSELASFLKSRRQRLTPEQLGLPSSTRRRVSCLRREEVAWAADVGITWYTWLEQGRPIKIAAETLDRIAAALRLDFSETQYLRKLAQSHAKEPHPWEAPVEPRVCNLVEGYTSGLALVVGPRWDMLAWNHKFAKLFGLDAGTAGLERNWLWIVFTQERSRMLFANWDAAARQTVAMFRVEHADYVGDAGFAELIEALSVRSSEFAAWWSDVDVLLPTRWRLGGIRDPGSGMIVTFQTVTLPIPESPGQRVIFHYPASEFNGLRANAIGLISAPILTGCAANSISSTPAPPEA